MRSLPECVKDYCPDLYYSSKAEFNGQDSSLLCLLVCLHAARNSLSRFILLLWLTQPS